MFRRLSSRHDSRHRYTSEKFIDDVWRQLNQKQKGWRIWIVHTFSNVIFNSIIFFFVRFLAKNCLMKMFQLPSGRTRKDVVARGAHATNDIRWLCQSEKKGLEIDKQSPFVRRTNTSNWGQMQNHFQRILDAEQWARTEQACGVNLCRQ